MRQQCSVSVVPGGIWGPTASTFYPNAEEGLTLLRNAGKKVMFVLNNSFYPPEDKFKLIGFPVQEVQNI